MTPVFTACDKLNRSIISTWSQLFGSYTDAAEQWFAWFKDTVRSIFINNCSAAADMADCLATIDMGRKMWGMPLFREGVTGPHLTQSRMCRGLPPCQVASSHLATIVMGQKLGGRGCPPLVGEAGSPSNTKSHGPRPTSIPSDILIHPTVWPQRTWAENWGLCLFLRGGDWVLI